MKNVLMMLLVIVCAGCRSTSRRQPLSLAQELEQVTVLVHRKSNEYQVSLKWISINTHGTEKHSEGEPEVLSAPMVTGEPDQWLNCDGNFSPIYLYSKMRCRVDGEMVEVDALPGVNSVCKVLPLPDGSVRVKGIVVLSKFDATGELIHKSLPFDTGCILGESLVLYEHEMKLDPSVRPML